MHSLSLRLASAAAPALPEASSRMLLLLSPCSSRKPRATVVILRIAFGPCRLSSRKPLHQTLHCDPGQVGLHSSRMCQLLCRARRSEPKHGNAGVKCGLGASCETYSVPGSTMRERMLAPGPTPSHPHAHQHTRVRFPAILVHGTCVHSPFERSRRAFGWDPTLQFKTHGQCSQDSNVLLRSRGHPVVSGYNGLSTEALPGARRRRGGGRSSMLPIIQAERAPLPPRALPPSPGKLLEGGKMKFCHGAHFSGHFWSLDSAPSDPLPHPTSAQAKPLGVRGVDQQGRGSFPGGTVRNRKCMTT